MKNRFLFSSKLTGFPQMSNFINKKYAKNIILLARIPLRVYLIYVKTNKK